MLYDPLSHALTTEVKRGIPCLDYKEGYVSTADLTTYLDFVMATAH